jgi:hypothetical protein
MKKLIIVSALIMVSKNDLMNSGYVNNLDLEVIFPGSKKVKTAHYSPFYKAISIQPLFGYGKRYNVRPEDFKKIVESAEILNDTLFPLDNLSVEIQVDVRHDELSIVDCEAVTNGTHAHPDYVPDYAEIEIR